MLSLDKLKSYIKVTYFNNISKAAFEMELKKDTLTKIVNGKRQAGYKTLQALENYCARKGLKKDFFLTSV